MKSRLPNNVEQSHQQTLKNFKDQEPPFYAILFDDSEGGSFEVPPDHMRVGVIRKTVPVTLKLYLLKGVNIACLLCSFSYSFFFVVDKVEAENFKYEITPLFKSK